jgi:ubiquinone/menaquinone biosynthesis C-methylase UbiE
MKGRNDGHAIHTTGMTLHGARFYAPLTALLTLGQMRSLREQTITLAGIAPGDAVLDVGCGTGDLTRRASRRVGAGGTTVGIDASPEMIAEARRQAARAGAAVDFQVAAVEALPFPDASFDIVLSSHHLPDDLKDRALAEMRRVFKPDGRLILVDFRLPATLRERLALPMLLHRLSGDVHDLAPRLTAAGFATIEAGKTTYSPVGYLRAGARLA